MTAERRKHPRFLPVKQAYAALGRSFTKVGRIGNISLGGLAFQYLQDPRSLPDDFSTLRIYLAGSSFHISGIPCSIAYDVPVARTHPDEAPWRSLDVMSCGVSFRDLTNAQRSHLLLFLEKHTSGRTP